MKRRIAVESVAPPKPECFSEHSIWVSFLGSAAEAQRIGKSGPLDLRGREPAFNYRWDFCSSCSGRYAREMVTLGRCNPNHLREIESSTSAPEAAS